MTRVTITAALSAADTLVRFPVSGVFTPGAGDVAYIDREAMELQFQPFPGVPTAWKVLRGTNGTCAAPHAINNQIYVGRPSEFSFFSPQGSGGRGQMPVATGGVPVPFINVLTGDQFAVSSGGSWQKIG